MTILIHSFESFAHFPLFLYFFSNCFDDIFAHSPLSSSLLRLDLHNSFAFFFLFVIINHLLPNVPFLPSAALLISHHNFVILTDILEKQLGSCYPSYCKYSVKYNLYFSPSLTKLIIIFSEFFLTRKMVAIEAKLFAARIQSLSVCVHYKIYFNSSNTTSY